MLFRVFACLLALSASACSSPEPTARPARHAGQLKPPAYVWPDSLVRYFPAGVIEPLPDSALSLPQDAPADATDCRRHYKLATQCLATCKAPPLYKQPEREDTYRFLWLRTFGPPVLLTLERTGAGGVLQTQYLDKLPNLAAALAPAPPPPPRLNYSPGARYAKKRRLQQLQDSLRLDSSWRAEAACVRMPVKVSVARAVRVSSAQLRQLDSLLTQADFQQLSSCELRTMLDGAYWFLEVRQAGRYHVVLRHSPDKDDPFRRCCELLLTWSPARNEERY